MRAYVLKHYGGPGGSRLMDVPAPTPGPCDILVEVRAAGLNPVDFKFRQGKLRAILRPKLPFVLGNELAGEVIAVGNGVKRFRMCDRVFARVAKERAGAFAEHACAGEDTLEQMFEIMKPGSKIVSIAALPEPQTAIKDLGGRWALSAVFWLISYRIRSRARRAGISYRYLFMHPSGSGLAQLAGLIEQGIVKVIVERTYPFAKIPEALAYVESGRAKGKVVVTMS
jgi:NADPH:quinone reductase-like Zn-dependent oxidoreductase